MYFLRVIFGAKRAGFVYECEILLTRDVGPDATRPNP